MNAVPTPSTVEVPREAVEAIIDWWRGANEAPGGCSPKAAIDGMQPAVLELRDALTADAEKRARRREALDELVRISEDMGLYDNPEFNPLRTDREVPDEVQEAMESFLEPSAVPEWWRSPIPALDGATPEVTWTTDPDRVRQLIDAYSSGAYL